MCRIKMFTSEGGVGFVYISEHLNLGDCLHLRGGVIKFLLHINYYAIRFINVHYIIIRWYNFHADKFN